MQLAGAVKPSDIDESWSMRTKHEYSFLLLFSSLLGSFLLLFLLYRE